MLVSGRVAIDHRMTIDPHLWIQVLGGLEASFHVSFQPYDEFQGEQ